MEKKLKTEILSPNDVLNSLWSKDSVEKCHIGLADAIVYSDIGPSKWYVTGKHGEISKKRNLDLSSVSSRWCKIATHQDSDIIAVIRKPNDILKFIYTDGWSKYSNDIWNDDSIISLHCYIKGRKNIIYRNTMKIHHGSSIKVNTTVTYDLDFSQNTDNMIEIDIKQLEMNLCGNNSINAIMNTATEVITTYLEKMLNVRVMSIGIDYVIDSQSQVWMLWTTEATFISNITNVNRNNNVSDSIPESIKSPMHNDDTTSTTNHNNNPRNISSANKPKRISKFTFDDINSLNEASNPLTSSLTDGNRLASTMNDITNTSTTNKNTANYSKTMPYTPSNVLNSSLNNNTSSNNIRPTTSTVHNKNIRCKGDFCHCQFISYLIDAQDQRLNSSSSQTSHETNGSQDDINMNMNVNIDHTMNMNNTRIAPFNVNELQLIQKDVQEILSTEKLTNSSSGSNTQNDNNNNNNNNNNNTNNRNILDSYTITMKSIIQARQEGRVPGYDQNSYDTNKVVAYYYEDTKVCYTCFYIYTLLNKVRTVGTNKGPRNRAKTANSGSLESTSNTKIMSKYDMINKVSGSRSVTANTSSMTVNNTGNNNMITSSSPLILALNSTPNKTKRLQINPPSSSSSSSTNAFISNKYTPTTTTGTANRYNNDSNMKTLPKSKSAHEMLRIEKPIDLDEFLRHGPRPSSTSSTSNTITNNNTTTSLVKFPPISGTTNEMKSTDMTTTNTNIINGNNKKDIIHMNIGRILLASNSDLIVNYYMPLLKDAHYDVIWVRDGRKAINTILENIRTNPFDCILIQKELSLSDAFTVTQTIRIEEKRLRKLDSAMIANKVNMNMSINNGIQSATSSSDSYDGLPPPTNPTTNPTTTTSSLYHMIICITNDTTVEQLNKYKIKEFDGCLSPEVDKEALYKTLKIAMPHHLSLKSSPESMNSLALTTTTGTRRKSEVKVFKMDVSGKLLGTFSSEDYAGRTMSLTQKTSTTEDTYEGGVVQLDADTKIPYIVMNTSKKSKNEPYFNLIVCHDIFDTIEKYRIFFKPVTEKYPGLQILLWNYPGQAFTEFRETQLINNEYIASCLNELLGQIGDTGTQQFSTSRPFYLCGYGLGMSIASFYITHYDIENIRGLIAINGWIHTDSTLAGLMHDCLNVFQNSPETRPDLPVYFYSRFLFSKEYLSKVSVPLALNIYTAVYNPITIKGRIALCKGVLKGIDLRPLLNEINCPIICLQSTLDTITKPMIHTDTLINNRNGEARSIYQALQDDMKTCIVWIQTGHELFQEDKKLTQTILEQLLIGFHETHDILFPTKDDLNGTFNPKVSSYATANWITDHEPQDLMVEDKFIDSYLGMTNKVSMNTTMDIQTSSTTTTNNNDDLDKDDKSDRTHQQAHTIEWENYSKQMSENATKSSALKTKSMKNDALSKKKPPIVLDHTLVAFEKQESTASGTLRRSKKTKPTIVENYPEVKEYMDWRLKRNKKRLQRLQGAAMVIQCSYRCYIARKIYTGLRRRKAAIDIQRIMRGWLGRKTFYTVLQQNWAARAIQSLWRGYKARFLSDILRRRLYAAITIQRIVRGHIAKEFVGKVKYIRNTAASIIQAMTRRTLARQLAWKMRLERMACLIIQRVYRGYLGRKKAFHEREKFIFSRSQMQGIEFGRQMLLEHKLHASKLQSEVVLLTQEKVDIEEKVEALLEEISGFEDGVRILEKEMHALSKIESEAISFMNAESKAELREQKVRLDQEFSQVLVKISTRKSMLLELEEKLTKVDKNRQIKDEELKSLERKLVVLLEEQQSEIEAIKHKQALPTIKENETLGIHNNGNSNALVLAGSSGNSHNTTGIGVGGGQVGGYVGPSIQEKKQVAQLMESTETLMRFGFMSMSMTYFSSLNMIQALRTVSAQDTVMAAVADANNQRSINFGMNNMGGGGGSSTLPGSTGMTAGQAPAAYTPELKRGQLPGQEPMRVSGWSVQDVANWLSTLSLSQYTEAFIDAAIDGQFLYEIDDDDLKNSLGIEHRLHRKKILNAIRQLQVAEIEAEKRIEAMYMEDPSASLYQESTLTESNEDFESASTYGGDTARDGRSTYRGSTYGGDAMSTVTGTRRSSVAGGGTRRGTNVSSLSRLSDIGGGGGGYGSGSGPGSAVGSRASMAPGRNRMSVMDGPKVPLDELISMVRHSKFMPLKDALDHMPDKVFEPRNVQSKYIPDHGTLYAESYQRLPFNINKTDENGNTMFSLACQNGNIKIAKYLHSKGANINHQNKNGQSPGHFAVAYQFFDLSHWLFENGGDDTLENKFGLTPYDGLSPEGIGEDSSISVSK